VFAEEYQQSSSRRIKTIHVRALWGLKREPPQPQPQPRSQANLHASSSLESSYFGTTLGPSGRSRVHEGIVLSFLLLGITIVVPESKNRGITTQARNQNQTRKSQNQKRSNSRRERYEQNGRESSRIQLLPVVLDPVDRAEKMRRNTAREAELCSSRLSTFPRH